MYDVDTFTSSFLGQSVSGSININKAIFQVDNKQTFIQIIEKEAI
jgi:hypothetical protein